MTFLELCRQFDFVREVPQNHGQRVNGIQTWGGGEDGESWCCYMATMWLDLFFKGQSPVPRTGVCENVLTLAMQKGWVVNDPQPGDLYVFLTPAGLAHHIGVVTVTDPLTGIAGNTSKDGTSTDGDGVYEHVLSEPRIYVKFIRVPGIE